MTEEIDSQTDKTYYTHGVSGMGKVIVVEVKRATRQQVKNYRQELITEISEEIEMDNPYRDGSDQVRKLNNTYDRNLEPFIPTSSNNSPAVWMRDPDDVFEDREKAEVFVEERNKNLFTGLRDMMMTEPLLSEPIGLKYAFKYRYAEEERDSK